ncbi:hypothetical protein [Lactobacillus taiwanensis]|uniref:hypothetical protein n=1 Tax=Lactobacillus taiwanensis TaxID=508451 RepID=UPI0025A94DC0|nr:hypothetical protein [Lactobacillus taiwanensis]
MDSDHPDWKYLSNEQRTGVNEFSDTYTLDTDYWGDDVEGMKEYIRNDLALVAGGGYNTNHIHDVKVTFGKKKKSLAKKRIFTKPIVKRLKRYNRAITVRRDDWGDCELSQKRWNFSICDMYGNEMFSTTNEFELLNKYDEMTIDDYSSDLWVRASLVVSDLVIEKENYVFEY